MPYLPEKRLLIPTSNFTFEFHSDAFTHFDGYLIKVMSIPKIIQIGFLNSLIDFDLFDSDLYYKCQSNDNLTTSLIPISWRCDKNIDCINGDDEILCGQSDSLGTNFFENDSSDLVLR